MFVGKRYVLYMLLGSALNVFAVQDELPLVVVIMSYNNAPWVERNLDSVFCQKYKNFHVIYLDDASEDGTADCVRNYAIQHDLEDKITLICNEERCRKLKNMYNVFHSIPDDKIIVHIDGDDWLAHDQVLAGINKVYQEGDYWVTYSQLRDWPDGKLGIARDLLTRMVQQRLFRKTWVYYPPRTFYPWLFKLIKLQDLLAYDVPGYTGKFYPASDDLATFFPLLEMAHYRYKFIDDVSYIRNRNNPLSDVKANKSIQLCSSEEIFRKHIYEVIANPMPDRLAQFEDAHADVLLFASDPERAECALSELQSLKGVNNVYVVGNPGNVAEKGIYNLIAKEYECVFVSIADLADIASHISSDHLVLMHDTDIIPAVDITHCIKDLEKTFAFSFYMALSPIRVSHYQYIYDNICVWKFKCLDYAPCPNITMHMSLYRTAEVIDRLGQGASTLQALEQRLSEVQVGQEKIGLFFRK